MNMSLAATLPFLLLCMLLLPLSESLACWVVINNPQSQWCISTGGGNKIFKVGVSNCTVGGMIRGGSEATLIYNGLDEGGNNSPTATTACCTEGPLANVFCVSSENKPPLGNPPVVYELTRSYN